MTITAYSCSNNDTVAIAIVGAASWERATGAEPRAAAEPVMWLLVHLLSLSLFLSRSVSVFFFHWPAGAIPRSRESLADDMPVSIQQATLLLFSLFSTFFPLVCGYPMAIAPAT